MSENTILLPDKISFDWLILNLLGHDFYHDYNNIVSRVEAIEEEVLTELDLLIDNYHSLKYAGSESADFVAALESENGQPYSVMHGGGGSDSNNGNNEKSVKEVGNKNEDVDEDDVKEEDVEEEEKEMTKYQQKFIPDIVIVKKDEEEEEVENQEKKISSSVIKNINYESQVLSLKMQGLLSNAKYSILQIAKGADANLIPMRSTPDSILEKGQEKKEGNNVLEKIVFKTITKAEYAMFLSQKWLPLVEISPFPYLDLSSEDEEIDYNFPTYGEIITYTQEQILKRIEEIKGRVVDKIGLLSLAPIFKVVIETSLIYQKKPSDEKIKNDVKIQLQKKMNDILNINSETSPYSKNSGGESSISFSGLPINNSYISEYLLAIFEESKVNVANLNERLAVANKQAIIYIDSLIKGKARPERKLQSRDEIKKQLNELIPKRLRELQTSEAPAYNTKARKKKYNAFLLLLNDSKRGLPREINEGSTPEELKTFEKFVLKLYHPDKGNSKKTSNYFYGEDIKKSRGKGAPLRAWLMNLFDPDNSALTLGQILPKPDKELTKQIWNSFGGPKGLRTKLNILSGGKYLSGGAFLRDEATLEQEQNVLAILNDILIRSLLLVILKKTKSIETLQNGLDTNFPIFPIQKNDNDKLIANYNYNRPKFVQIFSEGLLTKEWRQQNIIPGGGDDVRSPVNENGDIIWGNIYGIFAFSVEPPLNLEERKRIARILFLNVERLVLYYQLVVKSHSIAGDDDSSVINKKYLLQALGFIVDTNKQSYETCETRGFSTIGFFLGDANKSQETDARREGRGGGINSTYRRESNAKFGTIEEIKMKCIKERQKYFGWLFGDNLDILAALEQKRDDAEEKSEKKKYSKKINALIGEPPDWFRASTPDDQIQLAYNEIVRKLLPEYILTAGSHRNELYKHLASDVDFPRPVECQDLDCKTPTAIGKQTDSPPIKSSYIINNASQIYAQLSKINQPRSQFYNLDGMQVRYAQYCPVSSIADSMPLCSLPTKGNTETQKRLVFNPMNITVTYEGAKSGDSSLTDYYKFTMIPDKYDDLVGFNIRTNYTKTGTLIKSLSEIYKIFGKTVGKRKNAYTAYMDIPEDIRSVKPIDGDNIDDENKKIMFGSKTEFKNFINEITTSMQEKRKEFFKVKFNASITTDGESLCECNPSFDAKSLDGEGPFQAAATYLSILKEINNEILIPQSESKNNGGNAQASPTVGLFELFQKNIKKILNMTVRKSMGDYSQELATVSKFGGTTFDNGDAVGGATGARVKYNIANTNIITSEGIKEVYPISQPYDDSGNSIRLFVANDRPSAYRAIFFITQALDNSYNTKSMGGYYRSSIETAKNPEGHIKSEIEGKSFIVKAPMVIPSQLPEYYAEKYDESNDRVTRKNSTDQKMQTEAGKDILGYNQDEFMRWKEQQYKLHDNLVADGTDEFKLAGEKTANSENATALDFGIVGDDSDSDSEEEGGEEGTVNVQREEKGGEEILSNDGILSGRNYKMIFGGNRRHTKKNFKRISRNKTSKKIYKKKA